MAAGRVDVQRRTNVGKFNRRRVHAFPRKTGYSNLPSNGNNSVAQNKNGYDLGSRRCGLENGVRVRNDGKPLNIDGDMECKSDFGGLMDIDDMGEEDAVAVAGESELDVEKTIDRDDNDNVYMVMEYMELNFTGLMESMRRPFSTSDVKCLMLQLLEGVKYLHDNWVLHRDLKTSNLLLNNQGELKICDFGMARLYGTLLKRYTTKVVTQWYRAPELLLGAKKYSTAVDMWSVGCIMAELLAKEPLFRGTSEIDQLRKIFDILGTPNEKIWPGFSKLPGAKANYTKQPYNLLRMKFPEASFTGYTVLSNAGLDLLNRLLTYDPKKRITANDALNHEWFRELPLPKSKEFLPTSP
ncbi:hypothetical protein COLO4_04658 [Corchorus olitorius]|uniref:Protein kinase domain-containing protein n=1 Tax=Corchorus olitorius TaxID=93759 RepID=A0A1R3KT45_9ROSI|nr:hypothetical protein COLO4_04658 [Corchorus olitorius]